MIEAVFEELGVKQQVFGELEAVVSPECMLATNTSALSVTAMGDGLEHPERLVGMHFFNPVALMPLVELVRHRRDGRRGLATAWAFADRLGKRPVLVRDAPGFVVNRLLTRMTVVAHGGGRARQHGRGGRRGGALARAADGAVGAAADGRRRASPAHVRDTMHAAYPDRFPLSQTLALSPTAPRRRPRSAADERRGDPRRRPRSARRRDRPRPRRGRRRDRPRTSTPRLCSAPVSRSSSAASRGT